jgi:hypothetical protein
MLVKLKMQGKLVNNNRRFGDACFVLKAIKLKVKDKGLPQKAEVAQGVPGRLRPRIFLTFGTTRVVGRRLHAPAAFTPRRNPWYSFLEAESNTGPMVPSVATEKIPSVTTPGIDPETVRLVEQCINHYATPGPKTKGKAVPLQA